MRYNGAVEDAVVRLRHSGQVYQAVAHPNLLDPDTGRVTLCDLDVYQRAPMVNEMGRVWGSSRFMSPEEYELGAQIDVAASALEPDRGRRRKSVVALAHAWRAA